MQKMSVLSFLLLMAFAAGSQSPYTITAANFPVYTDQNFDGPNNISALNFTPSGNGNWDFSTVHSGNTNSTFFVEETDPFYTNAGIDVYSDNFKTLTPGLGYIVYNEFDFNSNGVFDRGIYVGPQAYGIGGLTGNNADSLKFPLQGDVYQGGRQVMKFPATHQSAWYSENRRVVNFTLTVAAAGLNNTPVQHVFTIFRQDSIVGWGQMRVDAGGVSSVPYNVLIMRTYQYAVDSFFIGGAPAPAALLAGFGISQGQKTDYLRRYTTYREGFSTPLMIVLYTNDSFTTQQGAYFDKDNLATSAAHEPAREKYPAVLFPNPTTSGNLAVQFTDEIPVISSYSITDRRGRTVQSGNSTVREGLLTLRLDSQLPAGGYVLRIFGEQNQPLFTEKFIHGQ